MKLHFIRQFLIWFVLLVCFGCIKRERFTDRERLEIKIQLARLADVPMPLGIIPILEYVNDNSFGYLHSDEASGLALYYQTQMDRYGWNLIGVFQGLEYVLVFEKPHKLVSIVIRKQKDQSSVVILTIDK